MMLAKELLELGERSVVVEFLKVCCNFWQTSDHRADKWIYILDEGGFPDFGPNVNY